MTIHSTTWWELVCDRCGRHEDLGAGLDECAPLPTPAGWRVGVYVDYQPRDYCPRCAFSLASEDAPGSSSRASGTNTDARLTVAEVGR